jgi:putative DNA primase/helicase
MSLDHGVNGASVLRLPTERDSGAPRRAPMALEWAERIEPQENNGWIVKRIVPSSGAMCVYAPSMAGKSFWVLDCSLRIATGRSVLGEPTRQVGVAYVGAEAANGLRKRIRAWMQENVAEGDEPPFALIPRGVDFSSPEAPDVEEIISLLTDAGIEFKERGQRLGMVVVDTLARAMAGAEENNGADMGAAMAAMERISEELGVIVLMVHHTGKDASRGARGHSSLFAAMDTAIELQHDEETGARTIKLAKIKEEESGRTFGFRLRQVSLGADSDGDPITSCVVEYTDVPAPQTRRRRDKAQATAETHVINALKAVLSNEGRKAPLGVPAPSGVYVAPLKSVRKRAFAIGLSQEGESPAAPRTRWNRAVEKLAAENVLGVWKPEDGAEEWLWLKKESNQ